MDRKYTYVGNGNAKDMLFMVYYQFLKHCFGFQSDYFKSLSIDSLLFKLDDYPDMHRKQTLSDYVANLYRDFDVKIKFLDSKSSAIHTIIDIIMGAAGYYGNLKFATKDEPKQQDICKLKLAKYIQKRLEKIQFTDRESKVFHWFENTGFVRGCYYDNRNLHKVMIWKFIPDEHIVDDSWENKKNLSIKRLRDRQKYWLKKQSADYEIFAI